MVNWWFGAWWFGFLGIVMKRAPLESQATIHLFESFKLGGGFEHLLFSPRKFLEDEPHFDSWVGSTTNKRLLLYSPLPSLGCRTQLLWSGWKSWEFLPGFSGLPGRGSWTGEFVTSWGALVGGWVRLGGLSPVKSFLDHFGSISVAVFKRQLLGECHARIL